MTYSRVRGGTVLMLDIKERTVIERTVARDGLKFAFMVWLVMRLALSAWGALIATQTPDATYQAVHKVYPWVDLPHGDFNGYALGIWNVYDTPHYVSIAAHGYEANSGYLTAFFPGYPLMIKVMGTLLFGQYLLAAILVANICAIFFFWFLYRLVEVDYGEKIARRAVILSAVFPTSFFLLLAYTEAPLLAFTVAALYYGRQHKWWLAGILAGIAALIKQPGIFLIVPLGYMYWKQNVTCNEAFPKAGTRFLKKFDWAWLLLIPLTAGSYYLYRYFFLQAGMTAVNDLGASEIVTLPGLPLVNALKMVHLDNPLLAANIMEIGFTILMIGAVAGIVLKIRSATYSLYAIILALVSLAVTQPESVSPFRPEIDMPRRVLIIFPIFIYLALVTPGKRAFFYVATVSSVLYLVLSGLFVNWFFVS